MASARTTPRQSFSCRACKVPGFEGGVVRRFPCDGLPLACIPPLPQTTSITHGVADRGPGRMGSQTSQPPILESTVIETSSVALTHGLLTDSLSEHSDRRASFF